MAWGLLALSAGPAGLAAFALPLAGVLGLLAAHRPVNRDIIGAYVYFLAVWIVVKLALDLWSGASLTAAAGQAGLLGLRLGVLLLLGLALSLATSPRSLGLGVANLSRPFLGGKAWQAALALALFVHFLPLAWHSIKAVKTSFRVRGLALSWWRRLLLFCQALLRYWSQKTWRQTLALASRGLDGQEAWNRPLPMAPGQWLIGLALGLSAAGLLLI